MKVVAEPVDVIVHFNQDGKFRPVRFKHNESVVPVTKIIHTAEEKLKGDRTIFFRCQSEAYGQIKIFELKFELHNCRWFLWKM